MGRCWVSVGVRVRRSAVRSCPQRATALARLSTSSSSLSMSACLCASSTEASIAPPGRAWVRVSASEGNGARCEGRRGGVRSTIASRAARSVRPAARSGCGEVRVERRGRGRGGRGERREDGAWAAGRHLRHRVDEAELHAQCAGTLAALRELHLAHHRLA